jgi:anti-sigma B factor antagonist
MPFDTAELEPFRCEVDPHRESVFVRPVGELDLATTPIVDTQLSELVEAGFENIVLDLGKLRFLDSTGLRLLLSWDARARAEGVDLRVLPGPPAVQRIFAVAGLTKLVSAQRLGEAGRSAL